MDPNGIAGTPAERWVWLAPDWSSFVEDAADKTKRPAGATRVKVRSSLYNDGRRVTVVLNEAGEPIAADGTPTTGEKARALASTTDPDQQRIFAAAGPKKSGNVYVGVNPSTGKPSQVSEFPDPSAPGGVRKEYDDTAVPASAMPAKPSTEPPKTEDRGGRHYVWYPNPPSQGGGVWKDEGPAPLTAAEQARQQADAGKSGRVSKQIGGKAYDLVTTETKGPNGETITEQHYEDPQNPGVKIPTPLEAPTTLGVPAGSVTTKDAQGKTTKTTTYLQPDGTTKEVVDTAEVAQNTDVRTDPQTGRRYETIRNPDGTVKEEREVQQPASGASQYTYPELKLAYGNITQELMAVSKDIYSRVGTGPGKITKEEADRLFKPIYEQAQMRVTEINGLVATQKSVWETQISTANQRLDAATRMAGQAMGMAKDANLMAPGTGAVAGQMVWDMMQAQKDFAGGMGGLTDTSKLPGYLQAAMGMSPDQPGLPTPPGAAGALPTAPTTSLGPGNPEAMSSFPWFTPTGAPPSGADIASANAASQAQSQAAFGGLGVGPPTAGEPGGPPLAPGPVWEPPAPPPVPLPGMGGPPPPLGQGQDLSTMPGVPPVPMPGQGQDLSSPQGYQGGGITINIGGNPQQPPSSDLASANYLSPTMNPQRPALADVQRGMAGDLMTGPGAFDEDVLEHVWQKKTGQSLLNRGGMAAGRFG